MVFVKSAITGIIVVVGGLLLWFLVIIGIGRARFHNAIAIDSRTFAGLYFWIVCLLLFVVGFALRFFQLQSRLSK